MRPDIRTLRRLAEREVDRLLGRLPPEIRSVAETVPVHFPARPDDDVAAEFGAELLGLFSGEAIDEVGSTYVPVPAQIHLFLENLWWEASEDTERFREEAGITYLHELGHYLGWDEDEIEARGIG